MLLCLYDSSILVCLLHSADISLYTYSNSIFHAVWSIGIPVIFILLQRKVEEEPEKNGTLHHLNYKLIDNLHKILRFIDERIRPKDVYFFLLSAEINVLKL